MKAHWTQRQVERALLISPGTMVKFEKSKVCFKQHRTALNLPFDRPAPRKSNIPLDGECSLRPLCYFYLLRPAHIQCFATSNLANSNFLIYPDYSTTVWHTSKDFNQRDNLQSGITLSRVIKRFKISDSSERFFKSCPSCFMKSDKNVMAASYVGHGSVQGRLCPQTRLTK